MDFLTKPSAISVLLLLCACQPASENVRGKTQTLPEAAALPTEDKSGDATSQPVEPGQAPVIFDNASDAALKLAAEVDQTALPTGFIDDIFAINKIGAGKTILFGKSKQAWLLDETKDGLLTKLTVDIAPPTGTTLYVLEDKNFWLIGKSSVAFPSTVPSKDPGQLTLINLAPDLVKDPAITPRILYAGPQRLILASDKRANIVVLDGDKARVIALDFPKMGEAPLPVLAAGLIQGSDSFWFLSQERLLLLKKQGEGAGGWRWVISKFKVDAGVPVDAVNQIAMVLDSKDDRTFSYVGRTFELAGGKLFEQNPIKLSVNDKPEAPQDPEFVNNVQPLLKNNCTPCHAGYDELATVQAKAPAFKQMIMDGSMPKDKALTPEQIKTLTDYLTKLMAP